MMTTQTYVSARIDGYARLGGMLPHTVYRIEVSELHEHEKWLVYRRFSDFLSFYHSLVEEFGMDRIVSHNIQPPKKEVGGTMGGNRKKVIYRRQRELQQYLISIMKLDNIDDSVCLRAFLDYSNKGCSRCQVEFGNFMIMKESFARVKRTKLSPIWGNLYVIMMRDYSLYILRSLYDSSSQALVCLSLSHENILIRGRSNRVIDIWRRTGNNHIFLQIPSDDEYESWVKAMTSIAGSVSSNTSLISASAVANLIPITSGNKSTIPVGNHDRHLNPKHTFGDEDQVDETSALYAI